MRHDFGDVDLFGLDEFGDNPGMPAWAGVLIGGGLATSSSIAIKKLSKSPTLLKHADGLGFLAGAAAGAAVGLAMPAHRHAGWNMVAGAFVSSGMRYLEQMFLGPGVSGWGVVDIERTGVIRPTGPMAGDVDVRTMDGMGIATIEPTGAVFSGSDMPRLLGNTPAEHRRNTATLLGVPGLSGPLAGISSAFGATIMGN